MTANYVSSTGLTLQTLADIVKELEDGFKAIYGVDINLDANSPDGQMINLFAQAKLDILDLINSVYLSFSPSEASGVVLDQRCALNGVFRNGATYTTVYISMVLNRQVQLSGMDNTAATPFTVVDPAGNSFYLITSATGATGGSTGVTGLTGNYFLFRAADSGAIGVAPNTITKIGTPTLGVVAVNNVGGAVNAGVDEETDAALRYRRSLSVSNPSIGYLDGMQGSILALDNVTHAKVFENSSDATDANGIPSHSIWPVVDGGDETEIANLIYLKRNAGCGIYGGTGATGASGPQHVVGVTQANGQMFYVKFSEPTYENLYIALTVTKYDINHYIDQTFLKNTIASEISYDINEVADFSAISAVVKAVDPFVVISSGGVGATGGTGASSAFLAPSAINNRWIISTSNIYINEV